MGLQSAIVLVLIVELGSPNFNDRERAHKCLQSLGADAIPQLSLVRSSTDREIAMRATLLCRRWRSQHAEQWANGLGKMPWIWDDCGYLARGRQRFGIGGSPEWQDYREATRLMMIDLYLAECEQEATRLLTDFRRRDAEWVGRFGR